MGKPSARAWQEGFGAIRYGNLKWRLIGAVAAALAGVGVAEPATAANGKNWSIDYESSLEVTTNLEQQAEGNADFIFRNSLEFSYFPVADADNSALFRVQALNQRYYFNPAYDSTFFIATALASRRLVNSTFGYGGYQFLFKQSDTPSLVSNQDNDVFAGVVVYRPLTATRLLFHGYQYDFLRAAVSSTSYQGHSFYVTYRDMLSERWINTLSFRSQWRLFDADGQIEWRNFGVAESTYRLTDWWSIQGEVIYITAAASRREFSFSAWNFGIFSRFSY